MEQKNMDSSSGFLKCNEEKMYRELCDTLKSSQYV